MTNINTIQAIALTRMRKAVNMTGLLGLGLNGSKLYINGKQQELNDTMSKEELAKRIKGILA